MRIYKHNKFSTQTHQRRDHSFCKILDETKRAVQNMIKPFILSLLAASAANAIVVFDAPFPLFVKGAAVKHVGGFTSSCQLPNIASNGVSLNSRNYDNSRFCGACIKITNPANGKSVIATVADECKTVSVTEVRQPLFSERIVILPNVADASFISLCNA
jgi:hypothetical protein